VVQMIQRRLTQLCTVPWLSMDRCWSRQVQQASMIGNEECRVVVGKQKTHRDYTGGHALET